MGPRLPLIHWPAHLTAASRGVNVASRQPEEAGARATAGFGVRVARCELLGGVIAGESAELLGVCVGLPGFVGRLSHA